MRALAAPGARLDAALGAALLAMLAGLAFAPPAGAEGDDAAALYGRYCASCHGPDRLGGMGPALLPESLDRLKKPELAATLRDGRVATQMPAFAGTLDEAQRAAIAAWITSDAAPRPDWDDRSIRASRIEHFAPGSLPDRPDARLQGVDLQNLFIVVEAGDHHATLLDGDRLEPIHRFPTRYALHGGPKFSADGRFVYFASRDGWISKFDIWNLQTVVEIRAGINTRNVAASSDGRWIMVANTLPHSLVLLDANLEFVRSYPARALGAASSSRLAGVFDAAPRRSFVAALRDAPEIWEISYDPGAAPIFDGLVHDYAMGEALATPGYLNPRRTSIDAPIDDFFFDPGYANLVGSSRSGRTEVINLDVRRKVADLDLPGLPHLGSGITWERDGRTVLATPNLKSASVNVIDIARWTPVAQVPTSGPGFFIRSHEATRYAWVDAMMGPHKDTLQVIDKASLETVAELRPAPGKTLAHVEFTRDGHYALASIWERRDDGGAIVVFDAATLKEVKRIPMDKPVGKYNVFNKVTRSSGTSH